VLSAYRRQSRAACLDGHVHAFASWGGVPERGWYDNPSELGRLRQGTFVACEEFLALQSAYSFRAHHCNPGAGWEKGLAEGLVGYMRRKYLTLVPEFADWPHVFNGDSRLVAAVLDRLTHRCHLLEFQGDSYRFCQSLATRRGTPQAAADLTSTAVPLRSDSAPSGRPKTPGKPRP
jgi:hypothetical protein